MKNNSNELGAINFPELPEGYFFRVSEGPLGIYPCVELRKRHKRFSEQIDWTWTSSDRFDSHEEEIEALAQRLADSHDARQKNLANRVYGDSDQQ